MPSQMKFSLHFKTASPACTAFVSLPYTSHQKPNSQVKTYTFQNSTSTSLKPSAPIGSQTALQLCLGLHFVVQSQIHRLVKLWQNLVRNLLRQLLWFHELEQALHQAIPYFGPPVNLKTSVHICCAPVPLLCACPLLYNLTLLLRAWLAWLS